jgi:CheY-like chemotaxis protein
MKLLPGPYSHLAYFLRRYVREPGANGGRATGREVARCSRCDDPGREGTDGHKVALTMNTTILLLNSDPDVRTVIGEALERAGYYVLAVGSLGKAVDALKHSTPSLLIIRSYIDNMPGHTAAKYLCTKCPGMRVLMVGGLIDDDRLIYREELEGFEIFPKPFAVAELLKKVKDVLGEGWRKHHTTRGVEIGMPH